MYRIPLEETILRDHNLEDHNLDSYTTFKLFELLSSGNMADVSTADGKVANIGPKIILYTNHQCPYAHRAHIALEELNLSYEEVFIDLATPREQWYLDINPRGLVPSIKYTVEGIHDNEIVTESAIVAQFLADSFPSALSPATHSDPFAPLRRARAAYFADTFNTKANAALWPLVMSTADAETKEKMTLDWIATVKKELEPLLADAGPFFGGSAELTMAEVLTAPFVLRWEALSKDGSLIPKIFWEKLSELPNFSRWAKAVKDRKSVTKIWDEAKIVDGMKKNIEKRRAAAASK